MAEKIEAIKVSLNQVLNDKEKPWKKALDLAEEKSGVPRLYIFGGELSFNLDVLKHTHTHTHPPKKTSFIRHNYHPEHVHCLESLLGIIFFLVIITCISRNVKEKKMRRKRVEKCERCPQIIEKYHLNWWNISHTYRTFSGMLYESMNSFAGQHC